MYYNLPHIEGIDWEKAFHYLPSKDVLMEVLVEFVKSASKQTEALTGFREAVLRDGSEENFASFRIQAHAMKASLRSLGSELFDPAFELETAGREGDSKVISDKTENFVSEYLALADRLKEIVGECDVKSDFNEDEFFSKIEVVKNAMAEFDISTLQEAFEAAADMDIPEKYREVVSQLEVAVRELDSEKVEECCGTLAELR